MPSQKGHRGTFKSAKNLVKPFPHWELKFEVNGTYDLTTLLFTHTAATHSLLWRDLRI